MSTLPPYVSRDLIQARLALLFPEGSPVKKFCGTPVAGSTVFAMLYIGAVEGTKRFVAPKHVYRMSDQQAALVTDAARLDYASASQKPKFVGLGSPWYADTTREPIRDETLRQGLISVGAVIERSDVAKSSPQPRYALARDFADLFDPALADAALDAAIAKWMKAHLSAGALARITIVRAGGGRDPGGVGVEFPNGETRRLSAGTSSMIAKAVIEEFAPRFLQQPTVLWLSEPGNKVVSRDDLLAKRIKFNIDQARLLPDIILVDIGRPELLIVFVEVVASDGPVTEDRRRQLAALASQAGFNRDHVAFVTAFLERSLPAFRSTFASLAWNSFAWLASEPEKIVALLGIEDPARNKLHELLDLTRPPAYP